MVKKIEKYLAILLVNIRQTTVYKTEFVVMALRNVFLLLIFANLYKATFAVSVPGQFEGLSYEQIVWLLIITRMFAQDYSTINLINTEIRSGNFAYSVNKPYSYILFHFSSFWGRALPKIIIDIISNLIPTYLLIGPIDCSFSVILITIFIVFLGLSLDFLLQLFFAFWSFWIEDVTAFRWILSKAILILGGNLIPIAMLPSQLKAIVSILPFASIYYAPARLLVDFNLSLFIKTLSIQLIWIFIISLSTLLLFRKGMKNVSAQGG